MHRDRSKLPDFGITAASWEAYTFAMNTPLDPLVSEFATAEEADAYDRWFRARVQASIDDPRPSIPHDQVMAEMQDIIEARRKRRAG